MFLLEKLIKGKPVADSIKKRLKVEVEGLKAKGIIPKLTIIRAGRIPAILLMSVGLSRQWQV